MQPAYYENLEEIQKKLWSMLDDAVVNRNSPFRIPVFICADQNDIDGRIVVLRKSDQNNNLLQFHTDLRSQKVNILKKNKNASLVFYDKEQKIQLRAKVICEINNKNSISEESWKKTQHISRRCYLTDSAPGSLSGSPTSGMISKLEDFDYTMEQSEKGYENFTVIKCEIKSIEWLYLAAKGHRRAIFNLINNKKNWLVP
ncbi:pyridoxamine 5'-phosphate oxidase family protein [Pelagibacteraceae bacterium]|jgi:pyridoxamine 5'-phosphate oxidase|nr:pyridoxamine 5'-phosphate oxidase family protein [Pelagibacteraceae bacterium]MDB9743162.1 pyridoxamine 5'-phosphate oxidase family protein [Pelagibacteraceae bacterium]